MTRFLVRSIGPGGGDFMTNLRRRITSVALFAFAAMFMALPAFAQEAGAGETAVNTAVADAASSATSVVTTGIPILLGVAALWVALKFGKRLLAKI